VVVSFLGRGNGSTRRKETTCHKLLTNLIDNVATLAMIGTDFKGKSNFNAITDMTIPFLKHEPYFWQTAKSKNMKR
jgi:hypothetical protein